MKVTIAPDFVKRIGEFAAPFFAIPIRIPDNKNHWFLLADIEEKHIFHSWNRFLRFTEGEALPE